MAKGATIVVDIVVNAAQAQAGLASASKETGKFQSTMGKMVGPAVAVTAAVAGIAKASIDAASRTQQAMGGLDAVFGSNADQMKAWAATSAETTGLSAAQYAEATAKIGAQLKNLGVPIDEAAAKSNDLVKLGADLAATYGGTTADAVDALGAALRGEADPAERYGLALSQTAIAAQMAKDGTKSLTGEAGKQAKAATILAMATEQAGGAIGQFARESDSAAGSAQIAAAQWEDAKSSLGTALLPVVAQAAQIFSKFAAVVRKYPTVFQVLIGVLAALAVAILIVNAVMWVMAANPIVLIVAAIVVAVVALVVVIVLLWKKCEGFRNAVTAVFNAVKTAIFAVGTAAKAVAAWFVSAFNTIKAAVLSVKAFIVTTAAAIRAAFSAAWRAVASAAMAVFGVIRGGVLKVAQVVRAVASAVSNAFRVAWSAVKSAASSMAAYVASAIRRITAPARAVAAAIRGALSSVFSWMRSASSSAASAVSSALRRPIAAAQAAASRIKSAFVSAFSHLRSAASGLGSALAAPFRAVASAISRAIGLVQGLIAKLQSIRVPSIKIPKIGKAAAPSGMAVGGLRMAPTARVASVGTRATTTSAGGVVINVTGALDPEAVARQIRTILSGASVRRRGVVAPLRAG